MVITLGYPGLAAETPHQVAPLAKEREERQAPLRCQQNSTMIGLRRAIS